MTLAAVSWWQIVRADAFLDWNAIAADTISTASRRAQKSLAENDPGVAVGQTAAAGILARRANDGRVPNPLPPPFTGGNAIGVWRPTTSYQPPPPSSGAPMATP